MTRKQRIRRTYTSCLDAKYEVTVLLRSRLKGTFDPVDVVFIRVCVNKSFSITSIDNISTKLTSWKTSTSASSPMVVASVKEDAESMISYNHSPSPLEYSLPSKFGSAWLSA